MRKLLSNKFLKGVLSLATGTLVAQGITIACAPIITRLYTPEEYGIYTLFLSISSFIAIIAMFRYENAIVLPKSDKEAIKLISLCICNLFLTFTICFIVFLILYLIIAPDAPKGHISNWFLLIPFFIVIQGFRMIANNWDTRKNRFKEISSGNIIRSATSNSSNILMGSTQLLSKGGLIIGAVFGQMLESLYLLIANFKTIKLSVKTLNFNDVKTQFLKHIIFFKINTPHILIDSLRNYVSPIVISFYFSEQILGYYSLMFSIVMLPVTLIGAVISKVYYSRLAYKYARNEDVMPLTVSVLKVNLLLAAIPAAIVFFFGEELFSFVFGANWQMAGQYASYLALYMYIYFVSSSIAFIPYVINAMQSSFIYSLIINISFFLIIILGSIYDLNFTTILHLINYIISLLFSVFIIYMLIILKKRNRKNIMISQ